MCRLCQLCAQVLIKKILQFINVQNRWITESVFVVIEKSNGCVTMLQWHRGGETDLVSGADRRCEASEGGAAAGGGQGCSGEQPA